MSGLRIQPLRSVLSFSRTGSNARAFHASSSVLRKHKSRQAGSSLEAQAEAEETDETDDFDLFDSAPTGPQSSQILDKAYVRQSNLEAIYQRAASASSGTRLKLRKRDGQVSVHPQALRQVVATSSFGDVANGEQGEGGEGGEGEVEELKRAVRAWRIGGQRVSKKAAEEIVGRCVNLGRPDVAAEIVSDRIQYGLPDLSQPTLIKLHHALLSTPSPSPLPTLAAAQPVSPTLALLRLSIAQSSNAEGEATAEARRAVDSPKARRWRSSPTVEGWAEEAKSKLIAAGGAWAEAVQAVQSLEGQKTKA